MLELMRFVFCLASYVHFLLNQLVIQCMATRFDFQIAAAQETYNFS